MNQILIVFAFVFFVIATLFGSPVPAGTPLLGRIGFHFGWAGLACWVATYIKF